MLQQIAERYGLLDTSQKIAIGMCVVVIAGSLLSLVHWSTKPELVPILAKKLSYDEMDAAEEALTAAGIEFKQSGRRLLAHEKDRYNAIRVLNKANALPEDFEFGFAKLMESDSTFQQSSVLEHQRQVALGYELAKVIASSPTVESAFVIIQQQNKRSIGQPRIKPSASVKITMKSGRPVTDTVVQGCANLVATAVAGLSPHDVTVFDTRTVKSHKVPDPDEVLAKGLLDERKRYESHFQQKVMAQLSYIPGVLASISVELDNAKMHTETLSYAEAELESEETNSSRTGSPNVPGETGVNPNVGVAATAGGSSMQSETEESRIKNFPPQITEKMVKEQAPFALKRTTAAITIPHSYLLGAVEKRYPDKQDVHETDREFVDMRDAIFARIHDAVKNILQATEDADVQVEMYYDTGPGGGLLPGMPGMPGAEGVATVALTKTEMLKSYGAQLGLGGLALLSIIAMILMVRKTTRTARNAFPIPEEEPEDSVVIEDGILAVPGGPVGQADISEGFLVGQEVDEQIMQNRQIDEQIGRLVDDDPEGVAELVRRWVEQNE
ncbi:MAG: hypothetical protein KAV82_04310 [Phycisphaerae bacterium]|nr:hypothetical protein [Phycisphaerae bacterium]